MASSNSSSSGSSGMEARVLKPPLLVVTEPLGGSKTPDLGSPVSPEKVGLKKHKQSKAQLLSDVFAGTQSRFGFKKSPTLFQKI